MSNLKYYSLTLILYAGCIAGAIFVDDISVVFEFVGAFGLSLTSFTLPAVMYLLVIRNPRAFNEIETPRTRFWNKVGSVAAISLSVFNMLLVIVKQIVESTNGDE